MAIRKKIILKKPVIHYQANWSLERLKQWIQPGDSVLDLGAGDCRLGELLIDKCQCTVTNLEVEDYNITNLPLILYNGRDIPFPDNSFDVVIILFVLHHTADPQYVLEEAKRVCRRAIIVFEDFIDNASDRAYFRLFHGFLNGCTGLAHPNHEFSSDEWSQLARKIGLRETWKKSIGRRFGFIASRHIGYVWEKSF